MRKSTLTYLRKGRQFVQRNQIFQMLAGVLAGAFVFALLATSTAKSEEGRPPPDAARGERLFNENCAACHNRLKKVGPYLAEEAVHFINAGIPAKAMGMLLRNPVRNQHPGSRMSTFTPEEISDADLDDIGFFLASNIPPPKTPPALGSAERGAPLYAQHCAGCHGANGAGGPAMPVAIFANELKKGGAPPNVMLGFVMLSARSGVPGMPTYPPEKLSDANLADIAAHIWAMPMPAMPEGAKPGEHAH